MKVMKHSALTAVSLYLLSFWGSSLWASEAHIQKVKAVKNSQGRYTFSVTLKHADKSWDHYANLWQIESLDGTVIAKRVLHHPHINEQPFTRSLSQVAIPKNIKQVAVTAGCNVDGINSKKFIVNLP